MTTFLLWWIAVMLVILVLTTVVSGILHLVMRLVAKGNGQDRCVDCGSRLHSHQGVYAYACYRCGRRQPWATGIGIRRGIRL